MIRFSLAIALVLTLAACDTAEERAEEHYQSALALLAEGDLERATVEFRNVFELNGLHVEARRTFAQALRDAGDTTQAYSQFLRLAEQRPNDVAARLALSEMSIEAQGWEQLKLHGDQLLKLVPVEMRAGEEGDKIAVVAAVLAYATALEDDDASARRAAADDARALLANDPSNLALYRVLTDNALRNGNSEDARALLKQALEVEPNNRDLHNTKLNLLVQAADAPSIRAQIEEMISRYPDDTTLVRTLLRFLISQGNNEAAEAFLRDRLAQTTSEEEAGSLRNALVQFLMVNEGSEAALAEVEAQLENTQGDLTLQMMQATIRFSQGEREAAIAQMSELIEAGEGPASRLNDAKVVLAGMLVDESNPVGARRLIGEVLESDPTHGAALRLEAGWLIEDDRADEAIALLRRALDEAPEDAAAMTLMARAHSRNGNHELARDFLALAFEASNAAPAETVRYAANLLADERYLPAEEAVITALRLQPGNMQLLEQLGRIYVAMDDWGRAEGVEGAARRAGTDAGNSLAASLRVARLTASGQTSDAIEFLDELAQNSTSATGVAAQLAVVGTLLGDGDAAGAEGYLEEALAERPESIALQMAKGATERASGNIEAAIATYRAITEQRPDFERAWIELIRATSAAGDTEAARAALDRALAELPEGANLLWAQASFLEQSGDPDGAIAIYERLYEELPNAPVVANNLASMISTYRTDEESLERAYAVARRLRGTEVPPMMDTYGWIALRRGNVEEARPYLEGAAEALAGDALVQFHYGMLLSAAGEREAAIAQLTRAIDLAGDDSREQFETARAEVEKLQKELEEGASE